MSMSKFAVIGAGVVGLAIARELSDKYPGAQIDVYEKEPHVAFHQSGHNSGVIHAGLYYQPGSLKATLCRRGVGLLKEYAADKGIPYRECGKVVVAKDELEVQRLQGIFERAQANGVPNVDLLDQDGLAEIEPGAQGHAAVHSPSTAVIDYKTVAEALAADIRAAGGRVLLNTEVRRIVDGSQGASVVTQRGREHYDFVFACAGLQSDRLAKDSKQEERPSVVPFFGQYLVVEPAHENVVQKLVYPVPDPQYPFLGVHVTRHVNGQLLVGPNVFVSLAREKYKGLGLNVRDTLATLTDRGFWKFAFENIALAQREIGGVLFAKRFMDAAAEYVPGLAEAKSVRATRGIRAQAMMSNGELVDDFSMDQGQRTLFLRNAPSPGATSSLAIAEHLVSKSLGHLETQTVIS